MTFKIHDPEGAPEASRELLAGAKRKFGFVPNLLGTMAEAPALLKAYLTLASVFDETSFDAAERQVVLLAVSRVNGCEYCVAAHSVIAGMQGVPAAVVGALRADEPLPTPRLEALRRFTTAVVDARGWPSAEERQAFLAAGFGERQVLEVVLGVGFKTLSNYTNHIASTPLDQAFAPAAWSAPASAGA